MRSTHQTDLPHVEQLPLKMIASLVITATGTFMVGSSKNIFEPKKKLQVGMTKSFDTGKKIAHRTV